MAGMAQGAVDSLLGRLADLLIDQAQLLGGIRGDVEFIKDEMESMNSLLLHLTEAQHRDHQVQAWMKQLVGLARECEGYAELYTRRIGDPRASHGLLGSLGRIRRLLCTVLVRHQVGTRIRDLKAQARDIGERRLRYGVTVPSLAAPNDYTYVDAPHRRTAAASYEEEDFKRRRALLDGREPPGEDEIVRKGIDLLIKRVSGDEPPAAVVAAGDGSDPRLRVFSIVSRDAIGARVARGVYQHFSVASSFDCKVWLDQVRYLRSHDVGRMLLLDILKQVTTLQPGQEDELLKESVWDWEYEGKIATTIREHLKDKRFLIVLGDVEARLPGKRIRSALLHADNPHGSAIIMATLDSRYAFSSSPYEIITVESPVQFFINRATKLITNSGFFQTERLREIFDKLYPDVFARKMFLRLLYSSPNRASLELQNYHRTIKECNSVAKQVVNLCYNELPSRYRNCLLYLTIFPKGHIIKGTSLARRWIAEGLITTATTSEFRTSATDEAEHYFDMLATRGFICPEEISATGDIKSGTVHNEVHEFITRTAIDVNFVETNMQSELAHHFSIHNRIGLQESLSDVDNDDILTLLPTMTASSQWQLLKVLDLEGCKGLKKHLLKSICKILLLKYLSLRYTDVTELPKQIKELQCLETLDIRQTKVRVLAKKDIVLPLLKYFLAGRKIAASTDTRGCEESISAVRMPLQVQRMKNLEILSHVKVSTSDSELAGIAELLKLRKLGVALHGNDVKLKDLFSQIEKLHRCLRSLSIRIDQPVSGENHDAGIVDAVPPLPQFIKNVNINGLTTGLPHLIQEHHQLAKITLSKVDVKDDALCILGKLQGLRCLRLQHKSYTESELVFKEEEFQNLNFLLVNGSDIRNISFASGAAPILERIVWSCATMEALSGIDHLPRLIKLELNGDCNNLNLVRAAIEKHPNGPVLKHNPHHQRQQVGTAVAALPSSTP